MNTTERCTRVWRWRKKGVINRKQTFGLRELIKPTYSEEAFRKQSGDKLAGLQLQWITAGRVRVAQESSEKEAGLGH